MYSILTVQLGLNPHFVLDEMEMYEIIPLIENSHLHSKEGWEQARMISFILAQSNSTKQLSMDDFITFPWEKEQEVVDEDEIERTRQLMEQISHDLK